MSRRLGIGVALLVAASALLIMAAVYVQSAGRNPRRVTFIRPWWSSSPASRPRRSVPSSQANTCSSPVTSGSSSAVKAGPETGTGTSRIELSTACP